jgi:type VI secretion system secreted protein Hcp
MKISGVDGEATDKAHSGWIKIESMSSSIHRSIPGGATDQDRARGETSLGDVVVSRNLDKSSVQVQQKCATGTFCDEVEIHLCTTIGEEQVPYLQYKLKNVVLTSYSFTGYASSDPKPAEMITMNYESVDWTYTTIENGQTKGNVPASYNPGTGST